MTDNEIIKALEYRIDKFSIAVLDLINRQKAEIERLTAKILVKDNVNDYNTAQLRIAREELRTAKSEAIKEFAERLKETMRLEDDCDYDCENCFYDCNKYMLTIDDLVKEMTEAEK